MSLEVESIQIGEKEDQLVQITIMLGEKLKVDLIACLMVNKDVFAWSHK